MCTTQEEICRLRSMICKKKTLFLKQKIAIVLFYHLLFILATKCFDKPKKKIFCQNFF